MLIALLVLGMVESLTRSRWRKLSKTFVRAEQKCADRVVAWLTDTPDYQQDPYF